MQEQPPKKVKVMSPQKRRRRKIFFGSIVLIVVLLIISAVSYYVFLSRVEISIKTVFNESIGGPILIQTKITNLGTVEITNISLTISAYKMNETYLSESYDTLVQIRESTFDSLQPWYYSNSIKREITFIDDQFSQYRINIIISFKSPSNEYTEKYTYIAKDYAFLNWEEKIQKIEW